MPVIAAQSLTKTFAAERSRTIHNIEYGLSLELSEQSHFRGSQEVKFDLAHVDDDVYIEFHGGHIIAIVANGQNIDVQRGPLFIKIPKLYLRKYGNVIFFKFEQYYSKAGVGLHKFVDSADGRVYIYSDFQPHDANKMAPFFDQPDLRAKLSLQVRAPRAWTVASNGIVRSSDLNGQIRNWIFERTENLPPYLYAVVAGPFGVKQGKAGNIPLRILMRKSVMSTVPDKAWFSITEHAISYFEDYFGINYPFQKYDQVILPELNHGGMENAAISTVAEKYLRGGVLTNADKMTLYNIVLHELAHQWVGNYVTLKWWDDLWLNESATTFFSTQAQSEIPQFTDAWLWFRAFKEAAYNQDDSSMSHPLLTKVEDSQMAFANFDPIVYGKGASIFRELHYYLGPEVFSNSLRGYLKKYAWGNADRAHFLTSFYKLVPMKKMNLFNVWAGTKGVDEFDLTSRCESGQQRIHLNAVSSDARPHLINIGRWLVKDNKSIESLGSIQMQYDPNKPESSQAIMSLNHKRCPDFVYPNYKDQSYMRVRFSENDILFLEKHISDITDDLTRQSIWSDLWRHVRLGRLNLKRFSRMAIRAFETERNIWVLNYLVRHTVSLESSIGNSVYSFWPQDKTTFRDSFAEEVSLYGAVLRRRLEQAMKRGHADLSSLFADAFIDATGPLASTAALQRELMLSKNINLSWKIILALCASDYDFGLKLARDAQNKNKTDIAVKNVLHCQARNPSLNSKKHWIALLHYNKGHYSVAEIQTILMGLFSGLQRSLKSHFESELYDLFLKSGTIYDESYLPVLGERLAPVYCDKSSHKRLSNFLDSNKQIPIVMRIYLSTMLDEDRICLNVQRVFRTQHK